MPCNTVQSVSVSLPAMRADIVKLALAAMGAGNIIEVAEVGRIGFTLGYRGFTLRAGVLEGSGTQLELERVKADLVQAYSRQVVLSAAARMGWRVAEKSSTSFLVQRGF